MINKAYDHIISLGSFCMTARQIRRRFPGTQSYPFDWWVTPTAALDDLVSSDFSEIFIPSNMKIVDEDGNQAVMCQRYGLMHYHDFYEARVNGRYLPLSVRAKCAVNLEIFSRRVKRMASLNGDILFIRVESGYVRNFANNRDFDQSFLEQFVNSLRAYLPKCSVDVLLLNSFPEAQLKGVYCDKLDHYGVTTWEGSDRGWDEMFDRMAISRKQASNEPATEVLVD